MIEPYVHMEDTTGSGFLTMTKKILIGENIMDINKCAAEILEKNLKSYREVYYVSRIRLKNLTKRYICQKGVYRNWLK